MSYARRQHRKPACGDPFEMTEDKRGKKRCWSKCDDGKYRQVPMSACEGEDEDEDDEEDDKGQLLVPTKGDIDVMEFSGAGMGSASLDEIVPLRFDLLDGPAEIERPSKRRRS